MTFAIRTTAFALLLLSARPAGAQSVFLAFLDPGQASTTPLLQNDQLPPGTQPPPPPPAARGTFYLDPFTRQLSYELKIEGPLVGSPLSADVHVGAIGETGPLLFSLTPKGNVFEGTSPVLQPGEIAALQANLLYLSVKTTLLPHGAVRGQIAPAERSFNAKLTGPKVVPPSASTNFGWMNFWYTAGTGDATYTHLETISTDFGNFVAIHLHDGTPFENGPIVEPLAKLCPLSCIIFDLTPIEVAKLRCGYYYVDIHTVGFPDGEIRGHLVPSYIETYGYGCAGTLPKVPKFIPYGSPASGGGVQVVQVTPFGFGLLVISTVGANRPLPGSECSLAFHPLAPVSVIPVINEWGGGYDFKVKPQAVLTNTWAYLQYFGADPGAPLGFHATHGLGVHYSPF